ncbi:MAG: acetylglutamate kinase [Ignavibacteria bacterium]|jgi:acetylglutamate kinase
MRHVIKIGGGIIDDAATMQQVLQACASFEAPFILVHGGGRIATDLAAALNIPQTMVDGRRITDAETLRVVTMTYAGMINKDVVARLQALDVSSLGVCGADMDLIRAVKREHPTIDYGFVGDVTHVDAGRIMQMLSTGVSLVVAPLTHDGRGQLLNTNADTIAAEIATALALHGDQDIQLTYLFDLPGVLQDINNHESVIQEINADNVDALVAEGTVSAGMMPKITMALAAARAGITVRIQHARDLGTEQGTLIQ